MPLLAKKAARTAAPHPSYPTHPTTVAGMEETTAEPEQAVDGSSTAEPILEESARSSGSGLPLIDWEVDGSHHSSGGGSEPCAPGSGASANCRTWITITIPESSAAGGRRRTKVRRVSGSVSGVLSQVKGV